MKKIFTIKYPLILIPLMFLLVLLDLPAAAQDIIPEKEKYGGMLHIAIPTAPMSLDARYGGLSSGSLQGYQQIYDHLAEWTEKGSKEMVPALATEWKVVDDLTWVVKLRQGVKFHNGKELTAQDVAENFDWKINYKKYVEEKGWRPLVGKSSTVMLKSVEALDRYTLKINLNFPFGPIDTAIGWGLQYGPIDPEVVEEYGRAAAMHPVGTGPFKFVKYVSGSHIIMERFDDYWGTKPYVDKVIFRIISDPETRLLALQKGEVDIAYLSPTSIRIAEKDPNLKVHKVGSSIKVQGYFHFNHRRWPMNQAKFRRAVAMGADWDKLCEAAFPKGSFIPWKSLFQDSFVENPDAEKLIPAYNPDKAKTLLGEVAKEAGRPIPSSFYALTSKRGEVPGKVLQIAANQLKKIGLNLKVHIMEHASYKDKKNRDPRMEWDVAIASLKGSGRDPYEVAKEFLSTVAKAPDGGNMMGYANPLVNELVEKGVATYDIKERTRIYRKLEKIILGDVVLFPLFNVPVVFGVRKNVHDFKAHPSGALHIVTGWNNIWKEKEKGTRQIVER